MQAFQDTLTDCDLVDMGYNGEKFTWHRGLIRERLDRGVCNPGWPQLFPNAAVQNLEYNHSDHRPLLLDTQFLVADNHIRDGRRAFEARWLHEKEFSEKVQQAWDDAQIYATGNGVMAKLEYMHASFHD